jgi:TatD DNase family protein
MIDTHCHVQFNAYNEDRDRVIKRTLEKGVRMITVGTQSDTSKTGLELARKYDGLWASVGLHPNHLCEQEFYDEDELPPEEKPTGKIKTRCEQFDREYYLRLAEDDNCVAIGECGLDYFRIPDDLDREEVIAGQKDVLRDQLDLADAANLPVIIHCRNAHGDQHAILRAYTEDNKLQRRGVIHCFTGTIEEAKKYIELGFMISFTGIITFPPKKDRDHTLVDVVSEVPMGSMMIETDAPYLTPEPHRGERNEPHYVKHVAEKIAEIKNVSFEEVAEHTTRNAERLFGIDLLD